MEGLLNKYTNVVKGWQRRWFLLDPQSGMLEYFEVGFCILVSSDSILYLEGTHL
jgi:hypothetical protein